MKVKIHQEENEISANVTKGYLESFGIESSFAPGNNNLGNNPMINRGPNKIFDILVEEKDANEAKKVLEERENKN